MAEPDPTLAEDVAAVLRSAADQIASADLTKLDWQPRRWELPPEPGPEVTAVRDDDDDVWTRRDDGQWHCDGQPSTTWSEMLSVFGPLTDATGEQP